MGARYFGHMSQLQLFWRREERKGNKETKTEGETESDEMKKLTKQKGMQGRQGAAVSISFNLLTYCRGNITLCDTSGHFIMVRGYGIYVIGKKKK